EIIIKPETTWILIDHIHETHRRIFTDGRDWPDAIEPGFAGYSIGKGIETPGAGRYDGLEAESRYFKGPRAYEQTGMLLHADNQSVIKERIYLDNSDPNLLHNEMTVIDNSLSQPWTVHKKYRRVKDALPRWPEDVCAEGQAMIHIGKETYW